MTKIDKIEELVKAFCPESGISPEKMDEWCELVDKNYFRFKGKDWDGIYQVLASFEMEGIDEQIIQKSASAIADSEDAKMNTEKNACTVFLAYAKKKVNKG